jgi:mannose-6-phosphate isomerase-like protein (cupin superfamily)
MYDIQGAKPEAIVKLKDAMEKAEGGYFNGILTKVNDHVVRISIMTEPYFWHRHSESDETFLVIEGSLGIEFEDYEVVLAPGDLMTVPRGAIHRTRPVGGRSVNLTVESAATTTEKVEMPDRN